METAKKIKVAVVGANGYTGAELIRLLLCHPYAEISAAVSRSAAGKFVYEEHPDLFGETELKFRNEISGNEDLVFLCLPHGESLSYFEQYLQNSPAKVIDLSNDFRYKHTEKQFVYGLPELNKAAISSAQRVANAGCFASAIQLALLPLAAKGLLQSEIHIHAVTGSTGAGAKALATTHFTQRYSGHSVYNAFAHPHLHEIKHSLQSLQSNFNQQINFIPSRGNFTRGIFATLYTDCFCTAEELSEVMCDFYKESAFVKMVKHELFLKQVVNTNRCFINAEKKDNKVLLNVILDNLLKGAGGQAVQNMNLMFGFAENTALQLKSIAY